MGTDMKEYLMEGKTKLQKGMYQLSILEIKNVLYMEIKTIAIIYTKPLITVVFIEDQIIYF